jgi:hypothetical protein
LAAYGRLPSDVALSSAGTAGQAQWLSATLPALLSAGASRVFWFQLYDMAWDNRAFGLLDSSLDPRPAFGSLAALALEIG